MDRLCRCLGLSLLAAALAGPAAASVSLAVTDLVAKDGVPQFNPATIPVPDTRPTSIGPIDVFDDPSAADEIHLPLSGAPVFRPGDPVISAGIRRAHGLLIAARNNTSGTWTSIFTNVRNEFLGSTIHWTEPGYDFKACTGNMLAFLIRGRADIYVCAGVLYGDLHRYGEPKPLGQIFIHQAAHLEGYWDECETSQVEIGAMRASGEGIAYRNGYLDRCGIDPD